MSTPSLSGFLEQTGAQIRLFDLGRCLSELPSTTLHDIDQGAPYPLPYLGYGWLTILLWNSEFPEQNSLWFLKLPLDEQGILSAGVHSDLVNRLYRALDVTDPKERQRQLTEHPYQFTPSHEKMAALHALAATHLLQPPSQYYAAARDFYLNQNLSMDWQQLGIQGIAELVCRMSDEEFSSLSKTFSTLPEPAFIALLQQLEHRTLPTIMVEAILTLAEQSIDDDFKLACCLRACAQSPAAHLLHPLIGTLLLSKQASTECLLTLATRYSALLHTDEFAVPILDQLAQKIDADSFARVVTNIAMQPGLNGLVMRVLASTQLTEHLANAISTLIQQTRRTPHAHH